ncbi:hypothetical protein COP1_023000 [Malus domestica]
MLKLTSTKQWRDEPIVDYINRWRNLSLDCKDRLSDISSIEMCVQGMQWGLHYILQGIKPRTFEKLATRAHYMELSITHHGKKEPITDFKKDKMFSQNVDKTGKKPPKEAFTVSTAPVKTASAPIKISSKTKAKEIKRNEPPRTQERYKSTMRELKQKVYPFPDSDMDAMLDDLLEKKVIELPECKRPEEMNRINDPKYYKYHRIVSHPMGKCFVLKELIMKLAQQGRIELDLKDTAATHTTTIAFGSFDPVPLQATLDHSYQCSSCTIPSAQPSPGVNEQDAHTDDEEGLTLVTYKKTRKPKPQATRQKVEQVRKHRRRNMHYRCMPHGRSRNEEPSKGKDITTEGEKTLTLEKGLPTHFSIEEALRLPKKMRRALAAVLESPNDHEVQESKNEGLKLRPHECATCCTIENAIHFTDEDLLLGSKPHNRPLFVSGYVREHKVNRMLMDGGSAINIMPKSTMTIIGIKADELSLSRLLIQGRLWIHSNGVIYSDTKPFTEAESHFADAKFYMDEDMEWQAMPKKQEEEAMSSSSKNDDELAKPATTKGSRTPSNGLNTLVFRYISMSRRKNGQSPFETEASKADAQRYMDNVKLLKRNAVLPLTQLSNAKVVRLPQGFVKALPKGVEPSFLPTKRTE